jgi:ABC-2 type transport system ATP-binding protein
MLGFLGLAGQEDKRMDTFSKGMKQKVLIISGLLHDPKIIFLDEPLSGLDANSVILVKEIIQRLAAAGKTIFYCSHMMDVVERVCDRIVLINGGRITADGSMEELRQGSDSSLEGLFAELTHAGDNVQLATDFMDVFQPTAPTHE